MALWVGGAPADVIQGDAPHVDLFRILLTFSHRLLGSAHFRLRDKGGGAWLKDVSGIVLRLSWVSLGKKPLLFFFSPPTTSSKQIACGFSTVLRVITSEWQNKGTMILRMISRCSPNALMH